MAWQPESRRAAAYRPGPDASATGLHADWSSQPVSAGPTSAPFRPRASGRQNDDPASPDALPGPPRACGSRPTAWAGRRCRPQPLGRSAAPERASQNRTDDEPTFPAPGYFIANVEIFDSG